MATKSQEIASKLKEKREDLNKWLEPFRPKDGSGDYTMKAEDVEEFRRRNDELTDIGKEYDAAKAVDDVAVADKANADAIKGMEQGAMPVPFPGGAEATPEASTQYTKTIGDMVVESETFKSNHRAKGSLFEVRFEDLDVPQAIKTLFQTSAGITAPNNRTNIVVFSALRRPVVADLVPQDATTDSLIRFLQETVFTRPALNGAVAEGALKPEAALQFDEVSVKVQKIAALLPVTDEQLADVPQARAIIDNRLTLMMLLNEEDELLNGTGVDPHIKGFYNAANIQNQNKGGDPVPDAIYKAITKVRTIGFAEPSGVVIHPDDWTGVRLLRTADGIYIWGNPADAGPERIWGLPVVITTAATAFKPLTGDFRGYSHISRRMGLTIDIGYNADDFGKNRRTIRAEERLSLEVYRGQAFATATLNA